MLAIISTVVFDRKDCCWARPVSDSYVSCYRSGDILFL